MASLADALKEARQVPSAIEAMWQAGNESKSAMDLVVAKVEIERLTALHSTAERALRAAERSLKTDDPALAQVIADTFGGDLHGIPLTVVTERPKPEALDSLPAAFVVQTKPHTVNTDAGSIGGEVEIVLIAPGYVMPLDKAEIVSTLEASGFALPSNYPATTSKTPAGSAVVSSVSLTIGHAYEAVPVMAHAPQPYRVNYLGQQIAHEIVEDAYMPSLGRSVLYADTTSCRLVGEAAASGVRTVTLALEVSVTALDDTADEAARRVARTLNNYPGKMLPFVGRVESVSHDLEPYGAKGRLFKVTLRAVSAVA